MKKTKKSKNTKAHVVSKKVQSDVVKLTKKEVIMSEYKDKFIVITCDFNDRQVKLQKQKAIDLFIKVSTKKESKHNFNVAVVSALNADSRAKKLKLCVNTHYDYFYAFVKVLINDVLDKSQVKRHAQKLVLLQKRH